MANGQQSRKKLRDYIDRIEKLIEEEQGKIDSTPSRRKVVGEVEQSRLYGIRKVADIFYEFFPDMRK